MVRGKRWNEGEHRIGERQTMEGSRGDEENRRMEMKGKVKEK